MKSTLKPHITEKSYNGYGETAVASTYTFKLSGPLSKEIIKKQVETQYKVTVEDVRTIHIPGKVRRFKGIAGRTKEVIKALVRLKKGDRITEFDTATAAATSTTPSSDNV